jgi:hypothetical protein
VEAGELIGGELPLFQSVNASASPSASMTVVLVLGARASGQASFTGP